MATRISIETCHVGPTAPRRLLVALVHENTITHPSIITAGERIVMHCGGDGGVLVREATDAEIAAYPPGKTDA